MVYDTGEETIYLLQRQEVQSCEHRLENTYGEGDCVWVVDTEQEEPVTDEEQEEPLTDTE